MTRIVIVSASHPRHTRDGGIDLLIKLNSGEELPFTARADDPEEHGRELYARALRGDFGQIAEPEPLPERTPPVLAREIELRESGGNALLANRAFREIAIAALPSGHYVRSAAERIEDAVAALGLRERAHTE